MYYPHGKYDMLSNRAYEINWGAIETVINFKMDRAFSERQVRRNEVHLIVYTHIQSTHTVNTLQTDPHSTVQSRFYPLFQSLRLVETFLHVPKKWDLKERMKQGMANDRLPTIQYDCIYCNYLLFFCWNDHKRFWGFGLVVHKNITMQTGFNFWFRKKCTACVLWILKKRYAKHWNHKSMIQSMGYICVKCVWSTKSTNKSPLHPVQRFPHLVYV